MTEPKTKIGENYKKILFSVIFPKIEETYNNILHSRGQMKEWRNNGRISDE